MRIKKETVSIDGAAQRRASDAERVPQAFRQDWITLSMRQLEPWIAGSIAIHTAWLAAAVLPGDSLLWMFVVFAALVAKSCSLLPSRYQTQMFLRGLSLVAGSYFLTTRAQFPLDASGGVFFFWLTITTLYYAFMLKPVWAMALTASALTALYMAALHNGSASWSSLAAPMGFLLVFPLGVAMRFGMAMRRADEAIERSQMDAVTGLYNLEGLLARGAEVMQACAADFKPATLVVMDCADLQEVHTIYGRQTSRKVMDRLVHKLKVLAGDRGVVARTATTEFALLLPGLDRSSAGLTVDRVLGRPGRIEYDAGDSEIVMVPNIVLAQLDNEPGGIRQGLTRLRSMVQERIQLQAEHERYLRMERERYSRPAPLAPLAQLSPIPPMPPAPMAPMRSARPIPQPR